MPSENIFWRQVDPAHGGSVRGCEARGCLLHLLRVPFESAVGPEERSRQELEGRRLLCGGAFEVRQVLQHVLMVQRYTRYD